MAKNVDGFSAALWSKYEYGGILKWGVPPLMGVRRGHSKTRNRGVVGSNMQWGHFVCPSSSQKRESTAFDLIVRSAWGLSSPGKRVGRSSTPCRKRSQVWGRESERWPKYMQ